MVLCSRVPSRAMWHAGGCMTYAQCSLPRGLLRVAGLTGWHTEHAVSAVR